MRDPGYQSRRGSSFKISYPDFPAINQPARSVTVYQEMGKHDIVDIFYPKFSTALFKAIKTGVPVSISWKNDKVSEKFFGYTIDVTYPTIQKIDRGVHIRCVGTSYPLKEQSSKIWTNRTITEVVEEIAKKHKLKAVVTPNTTRFDQLSLSGQSYWEKLNELAVKIGYGVQTKGTELHFHPIDKMINQFMTSIPVMLFKDPMMHPMSSFNAPTLDIFEPVVDDSALMKDLRTPCYSIELFSDFASSLYKIVFERTKENHNGTDITKFRLPKTFRQNNQFIDISVSPIIKNGNNGTVSWNIGSTVMLVIQGSGKMNVVPATGVTMYLANNSTSKTYANVYSYGMSTLLNVSANTWFINGAGVS